MSSRAGSRSVHDLDGDVLCPLLGPLYSRLVIPPDELVLLVIKLFGIKPYDAAACSCRSVPDTDGQYACVRSRPRAQVN